MPLKVDSFDELRSEYIECRDIGHRWFRINRARVRGVALQAGPGLVYRQWECVVCKTWKEELIVYNSGERFGYVKYHWPDYYLIRRGGPRLMRVDVRRMALKAAAAATRKRRRRSA